MRVGLGTCQHPFDPAAVLVLGGVKVPGAWGLRGRGDADVLLQAVAEALLGAAGLGDLEDHAPAGEARWVAAPSAVLLAEVVERLAAHGLRPAHADVSVLAARPSLRDQRPAMRARLASLLQLDASRVSVKTTALGAPGGEGGIAALAVVSLREESA